MASATAATPTAATTTRPYNLGPLTTTWVPPTNCYNLVGASNVNDQGWGGQLCGKRGPTDDGTCWPPTTSGAIALRSAAPFIGRGFYSPGLICPSGYAPACTATAGQPNPFTFQFSLQAQETAIGCCPSGYTCNIAHFTRQTCQAVITTTTSLLIGTCPTSGQEVNYVYQTFPQTTTSAIGSSAALVTISAFTAWAPMFQINHRAADITAAPAAMTSVRAQTPTSLSSTSAAITSVRGKNSTTGAQATNPPTAAQTIANLPNYAKAGIGVGSGAAIIIISLLAFFLWRTKKRRRDGDSSPSRKYGHIRNISVPIQHTLPTSPRPPKPSFLAPTKRTNTGLSAASYSSIAKRSPTYMSEMAQQYQHPAYSSSPSPSFAPSGLSYMQQEQYRGIHGNSIPPGYSQLSRVATNETRQSGGSGTLTTVYRDDAKGGSWQTVREINPHQPVELI